MKTQALVAEHKVQPIRFGASHGYRFDLDTVTLNAELVADPNTERTACCLELWACEQPYAGGVVRGTRVAQLPVDLGPCEPGQSLPLRAQIGARLPASQQDYAMVLLLRDRDADRVLDFANYARRERFLGPVVEGTAGYRVEGDDVVLSVERVRNTRGFENLSGSLSLELRALPQQLQSEALDGDEGTLLAQVSLGRLAGQDELRGIERRVPFTSPEAGAHRLCLCLREWAGEQGPVTRDRVHFVAPFEQKPEPPLATVTPLKLVKPAPKKTAAVAAAASELTTAPPERRATPTAARSVASQPPAPVVEAAGQASAASGPARVSIGSAKVEQLAAVNGLNRKLAAEIVKARPFKSLDDLLKVRGIGPKTLTRLRAHLTL